ncbi:hypothetical protein QF048_004485 [Streptomyces sp. W4I9-2]|nr:hypothetical protein [Streptomyces sp. W4I9-2]
MVHKSRPVDSTGRDFAFPVKLRTIGLLGSGPRRDEGGGVAIGPALPGRGRAGQRRSRGEGDEPAVGGGFGLVRRRPRHRRRCVGPLVRAVAWASMVDSAATRSECALGRGCSPPFRTASWRLWKRTTVSIREVLAEPRELVEARHLCVASCGRPAQRASRARVRPAVRRSRAPPVSDRRHADEMSGNRRASVVADGEPAQLIDSALDLGPTSMPGHTTATTTRLCVSCLLEGTHQPFPLGTRPKAVQLLTI